MITLCPNFHLLNDLRECNKQLTARSKVLGDRWRGVSTEGWPGWVGLGGLVEYEDGILAKEKLPILVLT